MKFSVFKKRWLNHFASGVSKKDIEKYVVSTGDYIWHVFSWKLLPEDAYLVGDEARRAYDAADKKDAIYIDAFGDGVCKTLEEKYEKAASLEAFTEVYVVGKDFSWTYIKTHEEDFCGPYFCRKISEN